MNAVIVARTSTVNTCWPSTYRETIKNWMAWKIRRQKSNHIFQPNTNFKMEILNLNSIWMNQAVYQLISEHLLRTNYLSSSKAIVTTSSSQKREGTIPLLILLQLAILHASQKITTHLILLYYRHISLGIWVTVHFQTMRFHFYFKMQANKSLDSSIEINLKKAYTPL